MNAMNIFAAGFCLGVYMVTGTEILLLCVASNIFVATYNFEGDKKC
jgi:hypothetical protein